MLENRNVVTRDRLDQLDAMLAGGHALERTLDRIAARDTDTGTNSRLFNASLDYYRSWVGHNTNRQSGPPALIQALRAERERYLETVRPTDVKPTSTAPWIDPYGSVSQPLDGVELFDTPSFRNLRSDNGGSRSRVCAQRPGWSPGCRPRSSTESASASPASESRGPRVAWRDAHSGISPTWSD